MEYALKRGGLRLRRNICVPVSVLMSANAFGVEFATVTPPAGGRQRPAPGRMDREA